MSFVSNPVPGPRGLVGPQGPQGETSAAVSILGELANEAALPSGAATGDAYLIADDLHVWDGAEWDNVGPIRGPQGQAGPVGPAGPNVITAGFPRVELIGSNSGKQAQLSLATNGSFALLNDKNGTTGTIRFKPNSTAIQTRIDQRGYLGVGIIPETPLHVAGDATVNGDLLLPGGGVDVRLNALADAVDRTFTNAYVAAVFRSAQDKSIDLYASIDGEHFNLLNGQAIKRSGGTFSGRDPALIHYKGKWLVAVTNNEPSVHDFQIFKSDDLRNLSAHDCILGATVKASTTQAMPGGDVPADRIWAPEWFVDGNGDLHVLVSIRYGFDVTEGNRTRAHFRQYSARLNDLDAMTFDEPVIADFGAAGNAKSLIDWSVIEVDGTFYAAVKDNVREGIDVYSSASLNGPYVLRTSIVDNASFEAPCWSVFDRIDPATGAMQRKYRIHADNNRENADGQYEGAAIGGMYYWEADAPTGPFVNKTTCQFDRQNRHGYVYQVEDNKAVFDVMQMAAFGRPVSDFTTPLQEQLPDGDHTLYPQEGFTYYVNGTDACNLTISADPRQTRSFYLAVYTGQNAAGIAVQNARAVPRAFNIGFAQHDDVTIEMRRKPNGQWGPVGFKG